MAHLSDTTSSQGMHENDAELTTSTCQEDVINLRKPRPKRRKILRRRASKPKAPTFPWEVRISKNEFAGRNLYQSNIQLIQDSLVVCYVVWFLSSALLSCYGIEAPFWCWMFLSWGIVCPWTLAYTCLSYCSPEDPSQSSDVQKLHSVQTRCHKKAIALETILEEEEAAAPSCDEIV